MDLERAFRRREMLALGVGAGVSFTWLGGSLLRSAWGKETAVRRVAGLTLQN